MRALLSAAILFVLTISASAAPKAFPGAVGYGADAVGGRGGEVCIVKTLADDGPNSLRDCVMRTTPRTVVFQVSGTIELQTQIITSYGFITIAGQSSPNGIVVRCALNPVMCRSPLHFLDTSEVIIRHLRILPGFFVDAQNKPKPNFPRANVKGITFERSNQIYLDHLSVGFTADETIVCFQGGKNWTIANSLNGDAFSHSAHHYGPALCGDQHRGIVGNITFVRNFMHSFKQRNPVVKTTGCSPTTISGPMGSALAPISWATSHARAR
jgi:pectate lyase